MEGPGNDPLTPPVSMETMGRDHQWATAGGRHPASDDGSLQDTREGGRAVLFQQPSPRDCAEGLDGCRRAAIQQGHGGKPCTLAEPLLQLARVSSSSCQGALMLCRAKSLTLMGTAGNS
eukprot:scaffold538_cov412-Prasinococcus_capsulatus_cf.AAC.2